MNSNSEVVFKVFGQKRELAERVNILFLTRCGLSVLLLLGFWVAGISSAGAAITCQRTVTADVVAIDQPLMFNRLGAQNINGMVYALRRDVIDDSNPPKLLTQGGAALPGRVYLRPDKRPRPLVLRVSEGDCLTVNFQNLLAPVANPKSKPLTPLDPAHPDPFSAQNPSDPIPSGAVPALTGPLAPTPLPQIASNGRAGSNVSSVVPSFNLMKDKMDPSKFVAIDDQVTDRYAGFHAHGMQLVGSIKDDGSLIGKNSSGLIALGESISYHLYAEKEGTFLVTSHGATFGSDGTAGNSTNGLFGSVNVEPVGARFYRSQVTDEEMRLAASADSEHIGGVGQPKVAPSGQPIIDYEATYPNTQPWLAEGKSGLPILNMVTAGNEIVHSDINAVIAGPDPDGTWNKQCPPKLKVGEKDLEWSEDKWTTCPYPLERVGRQNPSLPDRLEPFREFTVVFHDEMAKTNAFEPFYDRSKAANNPLGHTLQAVGDVFMINYGSGGIGSEIIANRLGVGPMHDCLGCNAEEFFLTSHAVGDPAMVVDIPANFGLENCKPHADPNGGPTLYTDDGTPNGPNTLCAATGPKATRAYYPDDPSNVHHSYISDHVKFRNVHTGKEHHIFHLHNHQWLYNPNDDNSNYLDAQAVGPGSGYTYEINFGGSGNRNKSAGDAIFHCHLYPHFAQGMWELWRNHDVFESGTPLNVSGSPTGYHSTPFALQDGMPLHDPADATRRLRALPDGEIRAGTPIPALIPLPTKAIAPMPGKVYVVDKTQTVPQKDPVTGDVINPAEPAGSVAKVDRNDTSASLVNNTQTPLGNPINPTGLKNPGFPFWIAGVEHSIGQRPPTPPLDMMPDPKGLFENGGWDGGLPRHTLDGTSVAKEAAGSIEAALIHNETRFDLSKATKVAKPIWFPEDGTDLEKAAMAFHAIRNHPSSKLMMNGTAETKNSDGTPVNFVTNGSGRPVAGAPFHEPCIDDNGKVMKAGHKGKFFDGSGGFGIFGSSPFNADNPRVYKGADIQFDAVLNKAGWHYPQERIIALWEDAKPIITKAKAPEPLVMRNNTFDCTMYLHTNLVPEYFEMDDYEVRTSTDIIGQHIHLPKWDLSTTDGSGNGWNYEDGTLAPGAVVERIKSINEFNRIVGAAAVTKDVEGNPVYTSSNLVSKTEPIKAKLDEEVNHPFFGDGSAVGQHWVGARTTLQRWFFDPVVNAEGIHRGLGIVFTHDHFGPSTHQQVGLYATVLVEPAGSTWVQNESGETLYDTNKRNDGGPTSWQAMILAGKDARYEVNPPTYKSTSNLPVIQDFDQDNEDDSFREFYLEYSDFQHAYLPGKYVGATHDGVPQYVHGQKDTPTEGTPGHYSKPTQASDTESYKFAINPPVKDDVALREPIDLVVYKGAKPDLKENEKENECFPGIMRPCPEAITADDPGTMVVNYRNEPIGLRIMDTSNGSGEQAEGKEGDLAYALQTFRTEKHDWFNKGERLQRKYSVKNATFGTRRGSMRGVINEQPKEGDRIGIGPDLDNEHSTCFPRVLQAKDGSDSDIKKDLKCSAASSDGEDSAKSVAKAGDPFTPMMRSYYGDRIRLKVQAGGDEETHNVIVHGLKWLQGGSGFGFDPNSGWRNGQQAGISEQFTFATPILPLFSAEKNSRMGELAIKQLYDDYDPEHWNIFETFWEWLKDLFYAFMNLFLDFERDLVVLEEKDEIEVQKHQNTDHLYAVDASTEGYWNGTWGLFRTYGKETKNLAQLPNNPQDENGTRYDKTMKDVCTNPKGGPTVYRTFDISAVLANDVLDKPKSVTIPSKRFSKSTYNPSLPIQTDSLISGYLNPVGGTLVYNPRNKEIAKVDIPENPDTGEEARTILGHKDGVLHDPTAILYVMSNDLEPREQDALSAKCLKNDKVDLDAFGKSGCPANKLKLKDRAPIEPLVLRVKAGECVEVTLRNLIGKKVAPDVLTYRQLAPIIPRNPDKPDGTVLNANSVHTTSVVGLHPALVAYDVTTNDGTAVGLNDASKTLASKGEKVTYRWYAGEISMVPNEPLTEDKPREYGFVRTPIEYGGINLIPADKIKQGQKGLIGALVIEPENSEWFDEKDEEKQCDGFADHCGLDQVDDHQGSGGKRFTRLSATVKLDNGKSYFRDLVTVVQKGLTHLYGDGKPVEGLAAEKVVAEDTEDTGGFAINYGSEPLWLRYGLPPNLPLTGPLDPTDPNKITSFRNVLNAHEAYSNSLAGVGGDPAIPVLTAVAGKEFRMHVLEPAGTARGSVFNLHGHVWQRAPYICKGDNYFGLPDVCPKTAFFPTLNPPGFVVGSRDIGINPLSIYLGGQDSILPASHFDIVLPKAGGINGIKGDYLYKDQAGFGNLGGLWGIVRVE